MATFHTYMFDHWADPVDYLFIVNSSLSPPSHFYLTIFPHLIWRRQTLLLLIPVPYLRIARHFYLSILPPKWVNEKEQQQNECRLIVLWCTNFITFLSHGASFRSLAIVSNFRFNW